MRLPKDLNQEAKYFHLQQFFYFDWHSLISALNSFRETMLILSVAIMCLGLAFIELVIGQANFGFMSLVGAVGLIGLSIMTNNSFIPFKRTKQL